MKSPFLFICLSFLLTASITGSAQNNRNAPLYKVFDCENCSRGGLDKVYQKYKTKGFQVMVTTKEGRIDLTQKMIDDLLPWEDLKQLCINAWYECDTSGTEYTYSRFIRKYPSITKQEYIENIRYLEILSQVHNIVIKYKN